MFFLRVSSQPAYTTRLPPGDPYLSCYRQPASERMIGAVKNIIGTYIITAGISGHTEKNCQPLSVTYHYCCQCFNFLIIRYHGLPGVLCGDKGSSQLSANRRNLLLAGYTRVRTSMLHSLLLLLITVSMICAPAI